MSELFIHSLSGEDYLSTIDTDEFYRFISRYKFVIAYENSVCNDYITEKLWRPLTLGVIPIYFGAQNIEVRACILFYLPDQAVNVHFCFVHSNGCQTISR